MVHNENKYSQTHITDTHASSRNKIDSLFTAGLQAFASQLAIFLQRLFYASLVLLQFVTLLLQLL